MKSVYRQQQQQQQQQLGKKNQRLGEFGKEGRGGGAGRIIIGRRPAPVFAPHRTQYIKASGPRRRSGVSRGIQPTNPALINPPTPPPPAAAAAAAAAALTQVEPRKMRPFAGRSLGWISIDAHLRSGVFYDMEDDVSFG